MNFGNNYDPVLQPTMFSNPAEVSKATEDLQQKLRQMEQMRHSGIQLQPASQCPVWDEIDRITQSLSEKEFSYLQEDEEFSKSQNLVSGLLTREYMRIMRPVVEATKDGQEALKKHLAILQEKVKEARNQSDRRDALFQDYMANHSDKTFDEYLKMKGLKK